ncbi:MAG TPA: amidohydrolase [Geminicoccaceae bacterium]|jgi:predicted TIM-barrel fold metal-dependent hydrolase|nr:amidohydrolase [Geminicoccaceae bacterium]
MTDLPIVDAHQHFWDLERNYLPWLCDEEAIPFRYGDYSALRRNYLPPDYLRDAAGHNVIKTVYVETEWDPRDFVGETRWLQEIIAGTGLPHGIVAGARLDDPDVEAVLAGHAACPQVRGIRHKPRAASSPADVRIGAPGSMGDAAWRRGYAVLEKYGLSFDLQTPWWHLAEAAALARDFPHTQIILNHTGLPADRSPEGLASWRRAMQTLAAQGNVALKISGLGQPGQPWTIAANGPVVRDAIAIFGADRCMFASNFPVDGLCADFDTIFRGFKTIVADLSQAEQSSLFCANALKFYRLDSLP